jgi:hypothetical protein
MKKFAVLIAVFMTVVAGNAQQESEKTNNEMQTVFGKDHQPTVGWYVGIEQAYTQFDERDVWMGGLNFGMTIDHHFSMGLTGRGWYQRNEMYYPELTDTTGAYLEGGYGGFMLEYTLFPQKMVHLTFPVLIGAGGATYVSEDEYMEWDDDEWDTSHKVLDTDAFFVIEPAVKAELNILRFMRLQAGMSYRFTDGFQMMNTSDDLMNNFTATVGLKFGKF